MNRHKLKQTLDDLGIPSDSYSLANERNDETLCLEESHEKWSIYYSERGLRTKEEFFDTEEKACDAFIIRIKKIVGI